MKFLILTAGIIVALLIKVLSNFDVFKTVKEVNTYANCTYLDLDIVGAEDMTQYNETTIIVGSGDYHKLWSHGKPILEQLGLYAIFNTIGNEYKVQKLRIKNFPQDISLYVHGIYIRKQSDGEFIYALNHAYQHGGDRVEVFRIVDENLQLEYLHSIIMEEKYNGILNDLIVIEDNRFLITKYLPYTDPKEGRHQMSLSQFLKTIFLWTAKIRTSYIVDCHFDKSSTIVIPQCTELLEDSLLGVVLNGITWNKKDTIWAADSIGKQLNEYKITKDGIKFIRYIDVENSLDNLEYNEERNSLILGLIPKLYNYFALDGFLKTVEKPKRNLDFEYWGTVGEYDLTNEKLNILAQGTQLPIGVSGALISGNNLFVGSWCDVTVAVCKKQ